MQQLTTKVVKELDLADNEEFKSYFTEKGLVKNKGMSQKQFTEFRKKIEKISVNEKNKEDLNFVWEDQKKKAKQFKWFN